MLIHPREYMVSTQKYVKACEKPHKIGLDLMAGSIAGFTSAFFGHPLE